MVLQQFSPLESFSALPAAAIVTGRIADEATPTQWQVYFVCFLFVCFFLSILFVPNSASSLLKYIYALYHSHAKGPTLKQVLTPDFWLNFLYRVKIYLMGPTLERTLCD